MHTHTHTQDEAKTMSYFGNNRPVLQVSDEISVRPGKSSNTSSSAAASAAASADGADGGAEANVTVTVTHVLTFASCTGHDASNKGVCYYISERLQKEPVEEGAWRVQQRAHWTPETCVLCRTPSLVSWKTSYFKEALGFYETRLSGQGTGLRCPVRVCKDK